MEEITDQVIFKLILEIRGILVKKKLA